MIEAIAIFGDIEKMGIEISRAQQLYVQLIGIVSIGAFCFFTSYIIFKVINYFYSTTKPLSDKIINYLR